jgi:hypothetical protein
MKLLLASGDSHTCGAYPNSPLPLNGDKVWARHLSDKLNLKYLNVAKPGAGTEEISMNTIMCSHNLINKYKENPQDIFVCVLWSVNNGKYLYWDGNEHRSYSTGSTTDPSEDVKQFVEIKTKLDSGGYSSYRDLYNIYTTAIALEKYGIPYLFLNNTELCPPTNPKLLDLWNVLVSLYGNRADKHLGLFNKQESFGYYLNQRCTPLATGNNYVYWGDEAHKIYANYVLSRINANTGN